MTNESPDIEILIADAGGFLLKRGNRAVLIRRNESRPDKMTTVRYFEDTPSGPVEALEARAEPFDNIDTLNSREVGWGVLAYMWLSFGRSAPNYIPGPAIPDIQGLCDKIREVHIQYAPEVNG